MIHCAIRNKGVGFCCLFLAMLFLPIDAAADFVPVDCGVGGSIIAALADLDAQGPHTVSVKGTCDELVSILNRERLTITGPNDETATVQGVDIRGSQGIVLRRLNVIGGNVRISRASEVILEAVRVENSPGAGIVVTQNSTLQAGGDATSYLEIRGSRGAGLSSNASVLSLNGSLTIEDNAGLGLNIHGGHLNISGVAGPNLIRNNSAGMNLSGVMASIGGRNTIRDNRSYGVQVAGAAYATFNAQVIGEEIFATVIEGHPGVGLHVAAAAGANVTGPHRIQNNGNPDANPFETTGVGGVNVGTNSRIQLGGGVVITDNIGPGVTSRFNGSIALGNTTISNNTGDGLFLIRESVAGLTEGNTITGNRGSNVFCDTTSLVFGDFAGITNIKCKNIERDLGPPRPGAIRDGSVPPAP